jgi:hypothetical protein
VGLKRLSQFAAVLVLVSGVSRAAILDTISYNFPLGGGGGGASAQLDKGPTLELFCVDFANDIFVPHLNYPANVTTLTSGSNLNQTRYGGNTGWVSVAPYITGDADDLADAAIIDATGALGRYQMAAYLVSQYNVPAGNTATNNGIQQAIWDILDPTTLPAGKVLPSIGNASNGLEAAAEWYNGTTQAFRDQYLANYRIISDAQNMGFCGANLPLCGGFQEQLTAVPEPSHTALLLGGLLLLVSVPLRKLTSASRA